MAYTLKKGLMYTMPTHFGPMSGPRQGPDLRSFANVDTPKSTTYTVSFLANPGQLEELCPPGFAPLGEPVVSVTAIQMKEVEWLAGRGYNVLGVLFPVTYRGEKDQAAGPLLAVLWENLADPILTGREQLGFSKIWCELPDPVVRPGETQLTASWLGFRFLDIRIHDLTEVPASDYPPPPAVECDGVPLGMLHYKYIPETGNWGEAEVEYAVLQPNGSDNSRITGFWRGEGTLQFHHASWEDMPTQHAIVNTLRALEVKEWRGATMSTSVGGRDFSDQRRLR